MRFGLHSGQHQVSFAELQRLWTFAREAGFDACYLFDHLLPLHSEVERFLPEEAHSPAGGCLEAFTTLAALARAVPQVGIGVMVAGAGYRAPGLVGHMLATLVQAAPGRVEIGLGAGWFEPEYRAYGFPFPPAADRLAALERALEAVSARLRGEAPGVAPVRPLPRLWVAGRGRILALAARYADSWNTMYATPGEFHTLVDSLEEGCAAVGRDATALERSIALRAFCARDSGRAHAALEGLAALRGRDAERLRARSLVGSPAECADQLAAYEEAGATHGAIMVHPPYDLEGLALLAAEAFPVLRG